MKDSLGFISLGETKISIVFLFHKQSILRSLSLCTGGSEEFLFFTRFQNNIKVSFKKTKVTVTIIYLFNYFSSVSSTEFCFSQRVPSVLAGKRIKVKS